MRVAAACALVAAIAGGAVAVEQPLLDEMARYMDDPSRSQEFLSAAEGAMAEMSPSMLLLMGDAATRRGDWRTARRAFAEVLARDAGGPWDGYAEAGLGWVALAKGRLDEAREHYGRAGVGSPLSRLLMALLEAASGRAGAADALEQLTIESGASESVRRVARMGVGYAHFWARRWSAAVAVLDRGVPAPLADDAEYARAMALLHRGDRETALEQLRAIARRGPATSNPHRISASLVALRPRAVLRGGLERYRNLPLAEPESQLVAMIDLDAVALARAALVRLDRPEPKVGTATEGPVPHAAATESARHVREMAGPPARSEPTRPSGTATREAPYGEGRTAWSWPLLGATLLGLALLWRRAARPRGR